jgi:hypothetical protein
MEEAQKKIQEEELKRKLLEEVVRNERMERIIPVKNDEKERAEKEARTIQVTRYGRK